MTVGNCVILDYKEAIKRINEIIRRLETELRNKRNGFLFSLIPFYLALQAQAKVLEYLNDENFNYGLSWNEKTGLPSAPSLVADVESYIRFLKPEGELRAILESFCGWTLFAKEKIMCFCGGGSFKGREVPLEIMLNHILETQESSIIIKQLLGVKTDDMKHLKNHYDIQKPSQMIDSLYMIWLCKVAVKNNGKIEIEKIDEPERSEQFNLAGFQNKILKLIDERGRNV